MTVIVLVVKRKSAQVMPPLSSQTVEQVPVSPTPQPAQELTPSDSGEGKFNLTGQKQALPNGMTTYTFQVVDLQKKSSMTLFSITAEPGSSMEIPVNAWSPDNKQLFLQANKPSGTTYYVFNADGSAFSNGEKYLDVANYWAQSKNDLTIRTASGWAGPGLLIIYTRRADNTKGPAFWFVTSTRKFMQLAH